MNENFARLNYKFQARHFFLKKILVSKVLKLRLPCEELKGRMESIPKLSLNLQEYFKSLHWNNAEGYMLTNRCDLSFSQS